MSNLACVLTAVQVEFFAALGPLFFRLNNYITAIDVWTGEKGESAKVQLAEATKNTECLGELEQLLQDHILYIPSEVYWAIDSLLGECSSLSRRPDRDKAYCAINSLFNTRDLIRESLGVDKLTPSDN